MENSTRSQDGLYLMLMGTVMFLLLGALMVALKPDPVEDFKTAYYRGVCLLQSCDPYSGTAIEKLYAKAGEPPFPSDNNRLVVTRNIYLPSEFPFLAPLASLPFNVGRWLWILLIGAAFIVACFAVWGAADRNSLVPPALIAFCLLNSGSLFYFGNPGGFVVPLTILAAWSFLKNRFAALGVLALAVSLTFKPHDCALVWLFFLLWRGSSRRLALRAFIVTAAIGLVAVVWASRISPHWLTQLSANVSVLSGPGSASDPSAPHGTCGLTNLQTITSLFWSNPHLYDWASYLICAPLFVVWGVVALRARPTMTNAWLALATIAPLSMLPVYHRQYDAKLILLAVPACALLWARRGMVGWLALALTTLAFFCNGDLPWIAFAMESDRIHPASAGPYSRLLTAAWDFPVPLSLLALGVFYLWAYAQSVRQPDLFLSDGERAQHAGDAAQTLHAL